MKDIELLVEAAQWGSRVVINHPLNLAWVLFILYRWIRVSKKVREEAVIPLIMPALFFFGGEVSQISNHLGEQLQISEGVLSVGYDILRITYFAVFLGGTVRFLQVTSTSSEVKRISWSGRGTFAAAAVFIVVALVFVALTPVPLPATDHFKEQDKNIDPPDSKDEEIADPTVVRETLHEVTAGASIDEQRNGSSKLPANLRFHWEQEHYGWEPAFMRFSIDGNPVESNRSTIPRDAYAPQPRIRATNGDILLIHRNVLAALGTLLPETGQYSGKPVIAVQRSKGSVVLTLKVAGGRVVDRIVVRPD